MSDAPAPDPSPSAFRPRSDTTFFLGLGSLGGFYLLLILALILALVIVPRWGKSDAAKLELMASSLKEAVSHLEAADKKTAGRELTADIKSGSSPDIKSNTDKNQRADSKKQGVDGLLNKYRVNRKNSLLD